MAFITAGYPEPSETVDIMLSLEKGGADIIELGVPFTDPLADGPTIQESSQVWASSGLDTCTRSRLMTIRHGQGHGPRTC